MGGREDTEQEEHQGEGQVPDVVEGINGGRRHLGEPRESEKRRGCIEEFEEEYSRDNKEVRRQEKVEDSKDYYRGGFPGRYTARRLFGWSDGEYDR